MTTPNDFTRGRKGTPLTVGDKSFVMSGGKRVEVTHMPKSRTRAGGARNVFVSDGTLALAAEGAVRAGLDAPPAPANLAAAYAAVGQSYLTFSNTYERWQLARIGKDNVVPRDLQSEIAGAGLVARHLQYHTLMIDAGQKVDERLLGNKPCDLLLDHTAAITDMLYDQGECGLDRSQKSAVLTTGQAAFIARIMMRNCCLDQAVARFNDAVAQTIPNYIAPERDRIRSDISSATTFTGFVREQNNL